MRQEADGTLLVIDRAVARWAQLDNKHAADECRLAVDEQRCFDQLLGVAWKIASEHPEPRGSDLGKSVVCRCSQGLRVETVLCEPNQWRRNVTTSQTAHDAVCVGRRIHPLPRGYDPRQPREPLVEAFDPGQEMQHALVDVERLRCWRAPTLRLDETKVAQRRLRRQRVPVRLHEHAECERVGGLGQAMIFRGPAMRQHHALSQGDVELDPGREQKQLSLERREREQRGTAVQRRHEAVIEVDGRLRIVGAAFVAGGQAVWGLRLDACS